MVSAMTFFEELQWRGMLYDSTDGLADLLRTDKITAYIGFDPTASSLHVGSLLTVMGLARLQRFGHRPIAIVGGGTGMIGDPSGKSQERVLLTSEQIDANVIGIRAQLERFLDFSGPNAALLINNADWLGTTDVLTFLRDVGKHFTVGYMLQKESVSRRMDSEEGISYTEFSYLVLQAYDYLRLFDGHQCMLQMGGSDQWGNITAGIELIRRVRAKKAHGLVWPLMKTASGAKFGKTEAGAVWLDPQRTSPFRFYQFWLNTDDRDVVSYLKFFTWLDPPAIDALERVVVDAPQTREAQRTLAREVTQMVHGEAGLRQAELETAALFGGGSDEDAPSVELPASVLANGLANTEFLVTVGLASSKGEAARLIKQGGFYINEARVTDERGRITLADASDGRIRARKGQRERRLVRIV
jgi:tyrosyl-tRNA synthetase